MTTTNPTIVVQKGVESFRLIVDGDDITGDRADYGCPALYKHPRTGVTYLGLCDDPEEAPVVYRVEPLTVSSVEDIIFDDEADPDTDDGEGEYDEDDDDGEDEDLDDGDDDDDDDDGTAPVTPTPTPVHGTGLFSTY